MVKTVALHKKPYFLTSLKSKKKKLALTSFILYQSRKMVGQFKETYLHRPSNFLHFLSSAKIQKCLTELGNVLVFLTINHLQAESRI